MTPMTAAELIRYLQSHDKTLPTYIRVQGVAQPVTGLHLAPVNNKMALVLTTSTTVLMNNQPRIDDKTE
jgi:hypothetical protein